MEKNELLEKLVLPDVPEDVQIAMMDSPDAPELLKVFLSNRHGDGWLTEKTERYMVNCPNAEKLLEVYLLAFCLDLSEVMEEEINQFLVEPYVNALKAFFILKEFGKAILIEEEHAVVLQHPAAFPYSSYEAAVIKRFSVCLVDVTKQHAS